MPVTSCQTIAEVYINEKLGSSCEKSFSYLITPEFINDVKIGSLVLVSFGNRENIIGLVTNIIDNYKNETGNYKLKPIKQVIPSFLNLTTQNIDFYNWIASQTSCSFNSVLMAAYPFDLFSKIVLKVKLANNGKILFYKTMLDNNSSLIINSLKEEPLSISTIVNKTKIVKSEVVKILKTLQKKELIDLVTTVDIPHKSKMTFEVELLPDNLNIETLTKKDIKIIEFLQLNNNRALLADTLNSLKTTKPYLNKLVQNNIIKINSIFVDENCHNDSSKINLPDLNAEQLRVYDILKIRLENIVNKLKPSSSPGEYDNANLLYGVTGSGKTMIYLKLIQDCLKLNKNVLILVPEISLTPSLIELLENYFPNQVFAYHSKLNAGQRYDTIRSLVSPKPKIILGARSAVLLPIDNLGLIIMDEEHDSSYKQTAPEPRYQTRDLCFELSKRQNALFLLVSATPDLSTYYNFDLNNQILYLTKRFNDQVLPTLEYVDMRFELARGNKSILSLTLQEEIEKTLARNEQVILLLNRRGYFSHVFCRGCGYSVTCNSCSIDMVYHQPSDSNTSYNKGVLICHHCGFSQLAIEYCPKCRSSSIKHYGLGIQRVEETCRQSFANAKVLRLDSDSISKKGSFERILKDFREGQANILIGTQLVAKGLNFPDVTLVGIILADSAFSFPDYRSMERGYQLLTQVSGRSGRSEKPGKVIMQTYNPDLPIFSFIRNENYKDFAAYEIDIRRKYNYPPFSKLIRLISAHENPNLAEHELIKLATILGQFNDTNEDNLTVLGPAVCPIAKLHNKSRFHLILKTKQPDLVPVIFAEVNKFKIDTQTNLAIDASPVDLI